MSTTTPAVSPSSRATVDQEPAIIDPAVSVVIRPWPDAVIDEVGLDPRAEYLERFWLAHLGPSATLLLRRLADGFDACPDGFELDPEVTAHALGVGRAPGPNGPLGRSLRRLCRFGFARSTPDGFAVRRRVPPLSGRQLRRLPDPLRAEHDAWHRARLISRQAASTAS